MSLTFNRRNFLRNTFATTTALTTLKSAEAQQPALKSEGLIVREYDPTNLESPVSAFATFLTPTDQFYVRNHFKQPKLRAEDWSLKIDGAVATEKTLTYSDLLAMPSKTFVSMLECAGNGRVFLAPREDGAQWANGGMGNAEWTGVLLSEILKRVSIKPEAVDIVFEGADRGSIDAAPKSPGEIPFARSLSLAHGLHSDCILAYKMNGKPLSPAHGYPVRLIVPGWYGMASIKWLQRITLAQKPFEGFFQSLQYSQWQRPNGIPTLEPITEILVKSAILRPGFQESIPSGRPCQIHGLAWAGSNTIARVEVSTDAGATWNAAQLTGAATRYAWRTWEYTWPAPSPGEQILMARATDSKGNVQPLQRNKDHRSYEITHVIPIKVEVE